MPHPTLPPLPPISAEDERAVFTHPGLVPTPKKLRKDDQVATNYKRLSLLGDTILSTVVTDYLYEKHPRYRVGPYHNQREQLINNRQLASWSLGYGLMRRLKCKKADKKNVMASIKVQASVLEAYIGAVFKAGGLSAVSKWIGKLIQPYITIMEEVSPGSLVDDTSDETTSEEESTSSSEAQTTELTTTTEAPGHFVHLLGDALNRMSLPPLTWQSTPEGPGHQITWVMTGSCNGQQWEGRARSKIAAKDKAARPGLQAILDE